MSDKEQAAKADSKADDKGKGAPAPKWQLPDYAGPLTINQAQWRQRNIKPVTGQRTK